MCKPLPHVEPPRRDSCTRRCSIPASTVRTKDSVRVIVMNQRSRSLKCAPQSPPLSLGTCFSAFLLYVRFILVITLQHTLCTRCTLCTRNSRALCTAAAAGVDSGTVVDGVQFIIFA